jgi:hypothetical protein
MTRHGQVTHGSMPRRHRPAGSAALANEVHVIKQANPVGTTASGPAAALSRSLLSPPPTSNAADRASSWYSPKHKSP